MRLSWIVMSGENITQLAFNQAALAFYEKYQCSPDTIKMRASDYAVFIHQNYSPIQIKERGKDYGLFIMVPGGLAELVILDENEECVDSHSGCKIIIAESSKVDREFEKHILKDDK